MNFLLRFSRLVDRCNEAVGRTAIWLVLLAVLVSAGNAIVRKTLNMSSNALLEVQWYLFAAIFLLSAGFAFLKNAHVRIDFIANRFSARTRNWIDIVGIVVFLIPLCIIIIKLSWPLLVNAWTSGEMSTNAGGLIRWPVYALVPLGFGLLLLQGASELVKRIAYLRGAGPDTLAHEEHGLIQDVKEIEEEPAADTTGGKT